MYQSFPKLLFYRFFFQNWNRKCSEGLISNWVLTRLTREFCLFDDQDNARLHMYCLTLFCHLYVIHPFLFSYRRQGNSTERGVPTFSVWYRAWLSGTVAWLSGTGCLLSYCSYTSVIMTSQRKAQRFPRRRRVAATLKRTLSAYFSLQCIYLKEVRGK